MKKLIILFLAFVTMQVSSQNLESLSSKATEATSSSSSSLIDKLAGDQVKKLTKKLNLSESQQEQVSGLVVSQLKSEKFSKLISDFSTDKLLGSSSSKEEKSDKLTEALANDPEFKSKLIPILDEEQNAKLLSSSEKK